MVRSTSSRNQGEELLQCFCPPKTSRACPCLGRDPPQAVRNSFHYRARTSRNPHREFRADLATVWQGLEDSDDKDDKKQDELGEYEGTRRFIYSERRETQGSRWL